MLYYFFQVLNDLDFSGAGLFQYLSFRAAVACIVSLIIVWGWGGKFIQILRRRQVKDKVRDLALEGQETKGKTPTMGGILILLGIIVPVLLFCNLSNIYVLMMLFVTICLGLLGFLDDYIKVIKKDKNGLAPKYKLIGQFAVGLFIGLVMYFNPQVVVRKDVTALPEEHFYKEAKRVVDYTNPSDSRIVVDYKAPITTIPFLKNTDFDYSYFLSWLGGNYQAWSWIIYIPIITLIIAFISNGANLTDGLDGLATGVSGIIMFVLGILAYVSGNVISANYLNIMYLPNTGELVIFAAAFLGACIGFLWYNSYPASVFMGDTGSLAIGGIIASMAILIRKEFLLPLLCGVFVVESLSVILQVAYFKYTKKRFGEGRRIFKMAPLHHHFQKCNIPEAKIVIRFWIISLILAIITLMTLKIR